MPSYLRPIRPGCFTVTVDYGYDMHSVGVSEPEWKRIASGRPVRLTGHGFCVEGEVQADKWRFNLLGIGSVVVDTDEGFDIFSGSLGEESVRVADFAGSPVDKAHLFGQG